MRNAQEATSFIVKSTIKWSLQRALKYDAQSYGSLGRHKRCTSDTCPGEAPCKVSQTVFVYFSVD